ncbi:hypothetical protein D1B17_01575 [Companilactobacillus zhachilii]|uniref:YfhO family protein n=1 Tax=Companilactobacillus zhachilii TaxID=2304606 RepID=A0A386PRG7_9LACO|nr:YfhO family protein [Companilactobacillus zhachilii]AYE37419.2 hypothetical protein D1B17_01575 [Companilactobacillus zhachilii]
MMMKKWMFQHRFSLTVVLFIFVSVFSIYLTSLNGHIWSFLGMNNDGRFHVMRIEGLYEALKHGQYFPIVNMSFLGGFGYISNIFYSNLWLYPVACMRLLGLTAVQAFVLFYILLNFCTLSLSFWAFHHVSHQYDKSLVFSLMYTLSIYRIFDMVRRFDVGEVLTLTFLPVVILGVYEIFYGDRRQWLYLALGMTAVIYAHALSPILIAVFILLVIIFRLKVLLAEPKRWLALFYAGIVALMLTLAYFLPMAEQLHHTQFKLTYSPLIDVSQSGMKLGDLIHWSVTDDLYIQNIGLILLLVAITIPFIIKFVKNPALRDFALIGEILLFLSTKWFPWEYFVHTPLNMIQFPWRFYMLVSILFTIFLASDPLRWFSQGWKKVLLVVVSLSLVIGAEQVLIVEHPDEYRTYSAFNDLDIYSIGGGEEYLPKDASLDGLISTPHEPQLKAGQATISDFSQQDSKLSFKFQNANKARIDVPIISYYGYSAKVSTGKVSKLTMDLANNGLGQVIVNGAGTVRINYYRTAIQKDSQIVSMISFIILMVGIAFQKKNAK